jgi:hypothetical protein
MMNDEFEIVRGNVQYSVSKLRGYLIIISFSNIYKHLI